MISTNIEEAARLLMEGQVVAIPTETVYGLAGNAFSEPALRKIFSVKQRPHFNPLIVHIASTDMLPAIASDIPEKAKILADAFWPGPLTLVLPKNPIVPNLVTGGKPTVAVRVPNHPMSLSLLRSIPFPLAAPSANLFGSLSPTRATHVEAGLGNLVPMVLDGGPCERGIESTIVGFVYGEPVVYRLGSISLEELGRVVGEVTLLTRDQHAPPAPGMLDKHYAPKTKLILCDLISEEIKNHDPLKTVALVLQKRDDLPEGMKQVALSDKADLDEAASRLYDCLHELDKQGWGLILAERMPDIGLGRSINDRLERAAKQDE